MVRSQICFQGARMRRIYGKCNAYAVITLAIAIMLSGCSIGAPTSSISSQSSSKNGITVWVMQDDFTKETLNAINKQFEAQTGVRVHVQVQPWDGISTKLTTALSTSRPPDVVDIGNTKIADFAASGGLLDITEHEKMLSQGKRWLKGLREPAIYKDKLYAVPAFAASRVVIYNKRIWSSAGITNQPTTFTQLISALNTIKQAHKNEADFSAMYLPGQNWFAGMQFVWDCGGSLASFNGMQWHSSAISKKTLQGLKKWADFQNAFSTEASRSAEINNPDQAQILAQQKASAVLTNSAAVTKAISINPSLSRKDFATFPMPSVNGKGIQPSVLAGSDWAIPSRSSNVALALKWIRIAASPLIQRKWIVEHDGWLPNSIDLLDEYLHSRDLDEVQKGFFETARVSQSTPAAPGWSTIEADGSLKELFASSAMSAKSVLQAARVFHDHAQEIFSHNQVGGDL